MRLLFRSLLLATLLPSAAMAQVITGPMPADRARAAANPAIRPAVTKTGVITGSQLGTAALSLPFFDDFTLPIEGTPKATNWQGAATDYPNQSNTIHYLGGGAYVSNRLAVDPLTRGTVTLDGFSGAGVAYNPRQATGFGQTDTLTSQIIDLSGLSAASRVYLSFAWQTGSVVGAPNSNSGSRPVNLVLEFLTADGSWVQAWSYASRGVVTKFKQQILPLDQAAYLHGNFRFRFRASGSQTLNTDAFGLDYIYLNRNRAANDTVFQDIATSRNLNSPLRPYTSLPVWQYNAAPTPPLNPTLTTTLNSLTAQGTTPTPVSWTGTVRELTSGGFNAAQWLSGGRPIVAAARQEVVTGDATTAPLPATPATKRLRYQLAVQTLETNPLTLPNDTISRDVELSNYYAYDDGTAEYIFGLQASNNNPTSFVAISYTLNQPDQVKSLLVAPVFNNIAAADGGENSQPRPIIIAVWADNNGKPANTPLATATASIPNPLPNGQTFIEIPFTAPVPVKGRFYVGYGQPSNGQFLLYGLDLNNQLPVNTLFFNTQGTTATDPWQTVVLPTPGAPMFRPIMTNNIALATQAQQAAAAYTLYPNPAGSGTMVAVAGPTFRQAVLLDVLGRPVWRQPTAEAGQPTLRLPSSLAGGVYLVQLTLPDGSIATRRLVVE
jgi:hypothetical protein